MRCLIHKKPDGSQHTLAVNGQPVVIGRLGDAAITVDDPAVSRHHCVIRCVDNQFQLCDRASANGTLCNGVLVSESPLRSGDEIRIGNTTLNFHYDARAGAIIICESPVVAPVDETQPAAAPTGMARRLQAILDANPWQPLAVAASLDKQLAAIPGVLTIRVRRTPPRHA